MLMQESSLLLERQGKVEAFYYRTDIIYTMPGTKNEIVILDKSGKCRLQKHGLIINLKEAHALFLKICKQKDKCRFLTCTYCPKNVLLLGNSPKEQCKCQVHENLIMKLQAMGSDYRKVW